MNRRTTNTSIPDTEGKLSWACWTEEQWETERLWRCGKGRTIFSVVLGIQLPFWSSDPGLFANTCAYWRFWSDHPSRTTARLCCPLLSKTLTICVRNWTVGNFIKDGLETEDKVPIRKKSMFTSEQTPGVFTGSSTCRPGTSHMTLIWPIWRVQIGYRVWLNSSIWTIRTRLKIQVTNSMCPESQGRDL